MQNTSTYNTNRNRVRKVVLKNGGSIVETRFYVGDYEYFVRTAGSNAVERKTLKISDDKQVAALAETRLIASLPNSTTIRYQKKSPAQLMNRRFQLNITV